MTAATITNVATTIAITAIPIVLGLGVVIQGLMNRRIGAAIGLTTAVLINAIVFFVLSLAVIGASYIKPELFPEMLRPPTTSFRDAAQTGPSFWVYWIPGFFGFLLVLGVPFSIQQLGPSKTFIVLIVAQVFFSLLAERLFFDAGFNSMKLIGTLLAVTGAAIVASN
ncbi:MAG: DMT family transporter [Deltaproteobacteria bacterium]|jgi:uncharacterized membrane protein YdcZ (DUF606 family)|nr:DMT family transporter [Deltaproteobacteria bacterium]